ncbi:hemerythrin domain-containing protein [Micromonospora phytophila]|uniref:hemerythrin domain-containing protein n=1 Tax=Micromonospora phytophila TaxID=709888 RepID=UPI00202DD776|nr:hemerythrin domain-containing protein [Micromonospora phytophila]MCM0677716.1 hemerythrin domain-containing protein [Micromonospora phytophila]
MDGEADRVVQHRDELVDWLHASCCRMRTPRRPALYPAAGERPEGSLLVRGMLDEHHMIARLIGDLTAGTRPVDVAAKARALAVLFAVHLAKENNQIVPLLVDAADVSLATLLDGMHDLLGSRARRTADAVGAGATCGGDQGTTSPRHRP